MRKITLFIVLCAFTLPVLSQSLSYQDLAVLFSKENNSGTARFNAMGGAFGALGGDISAIKINPAGAAVFKNSLFSSSVNIRNTDIKSTYYENSNNSENNYFNFSQIGAVFIFNNNSDWTKLAFGFNYNIYNDFRNNFTANGNSGFASFNKYPLDEGDIITQYNNAESQQFTNTYEGEISEYNFAVSGVYQNDLYLGVAINTFDLKFNQYSILEEQNNDGKGDFLDAELRQTNSTLGTAFSLSAGVIYKAIKGLRLGLSYQTPIWLTEINEETNVVDNDGFYGKTEIRVDSDQDFYYSNDDDDYQYNNFSYKLKTPGKITTSLAYIFGSNGLISIDYTYKNFRKIKLSNTDFSNENKDFLDDLKNTHTINFGTEWRFKVLSLRSGFHYKQSPYQNAISAENIKRYSFGAGYNFGNMRIDFAYQNGTHTDIYDFYPEYDEVNSADLNIDNSVFTLTLNLSI